MPVSRSIAFIVWFIASIFYAYQYVLRVMPSVMMTDIIQHFHIDTVIFGQFSGLYYIGYSLMHLPIGIMLDRFGPRKVMTACILLTVLGLLPVIFADNWIYPVLGRVLMGMGSSAAILGAFKIIRMTFKEQQFTRMLSFSVTIGLLGAIYGGGPLAYLYKLVGYKVVVQLFSGFGLLLALLTWCVVPEMKTIPSGSVFSNLKEVLSNRRVVFLCLFAGFMVGPLEGFADVWGSGFLKQVYGFDVTVASYIPSMIFFGMCFGAPVLSFIAEKIGNYVAVIAATGIIMTLGFLVFIFCNLSINTMIITFIIIGICCAYQILAIYQASTYVDDHVVGLTTAVANMIIMSFGYAVHTTIGIVVNALGGTHVTKALIYGVGVIPAMLAIGTLGFLIMLWQASRKKTN